MAKQRKRRAKKKALARKNPPMKRLKRSTGWMPARAVRIVKRGGKTEILIRKAGKRK
jgi:hypothetical protein